MYGMVGCGIYDLGGIDSGDITRNCPKFFGYPILTQKRVKLIGRTSNLTGA